MPYISNFISGNKFVNFLRKFSRSSNFPFFNKDEVVTYNDINDLAKKIEKYSMDDALRQKIAKKGRDKYFKFFNSTIVAEFIINKSLNINKKFFWENNKS